MAMSLKHSFKESGSDEARDNEDDTEVCSHCATDEKLQRALYFCYNCGVFGRYICGKCLTHHNRIVKSHRVEMISNQSMSRGQTLETELEKERKNVEELRNKHVDSMKQIETYLKERQTLQKELEIEKKSVKEKSHFLDDKEKQIKDLEKVIREKDDQLKALGDEAEHLSKRLKDENMKRTNVERDLKEREKVAIGLERLANDNFAEQQQLKAKVKELNSACMTLAKEKNQVEQHAKNMEVNFKDKKRKSDDQFKKLLAERDDLRQRQTLKTELEIEKKSVKEKSHVLDDREKQIKDLEKVIREKDDQLKALGVDAEHLSKRLKDENMKRTNIERDVKEKEKLAMMLERQANDNYAENQQLQARVKELESACKTLAKKKNQIEQHAKKTIEHMEGYFKDEKRKSDDEYKKLLAERDDLRDRFSKLAGKKLQEQNADIEDLSDPNRARKLSEKFGKIFDDEWTNALENLTDKKPGLPLKDAINVLLRLLQECCTFCNNLMATQMDSLQNMFLHPARNLANFDQKKTELTDRPRVISKDQLSLKDLRKQVGVSPSVIEEVKQALLADSKTWDKREKREFDKKHIEACTPYLQKCAEICWLMALHDPPLLMKMDVKQGEKFDTDIYRVYSQSGQTIDFLVWPPLYNGRDGGLLSKGVAEPVKVVSKKK